MNDIKQTLRTAQDAIGGGAVADMDERTAIRSRVGRARRRRAVGAVLASGAGLAVVGAATVAFAYGPAEPQAPAGGDGSSAEPSPSAAAEVPVIERAYDDYDGAVEVAIAGGETATFYQSSEADAGGMMLAEPVTGPTVDPIDASTLARLRDDGALVKVDVADRDGAADLESSRIMLAFADGTSQEAVDLLALSADLGLGADVTAMVDVDSERGRALLAFDDSYGDTVLLLWDLSSGGTTVLASSTFEPTASTAAGLEASSRVVWEALAWVDDGWLVWATAPSTVAGEQGTVRDVALRIGPDGSSWSTDGMWVDRFESEGEAPAGIDGGDIPGNPGSLAGVGLWFGGAESIGWFAVGGDGSLTELCSPEPLDVSCRAIGTTADGQVVVMEGTRPYLVDTDTGEKVEMPGVSERAALGGESIPLGDGYVELPSAYTGATVALWHRPDGDVEIEVPDHGDYGVAESKGTAAWLVAAGSGPGVAVIGEDGVWREVDLGLDSDDESISTGVIAVF